MELRNLAYLLTFSSALTAHATNYYVAANGSDTNDGLSPSTPWNTLTMVDALKYSYVPGDSLFFQRGDTFRGTFDIGSSGTAAAPIYFGAYGSGDAPIISGGTPLTGWVPHTGGQWKISVPSAIKYVHMGGELQTLARYPNTGWLRNDQGSPTHLTDAALTQPDGYWTGAEAVIRNSNWSYFNAPITSYSAQTLNFTTMYKDLLDYEWGYFMRNKYEELDAPGEWFYSSSGNTLYFIPPNGTDPNTLMMEGTVINRAVRTQNNRHNITIEGLHFRDYHYAAIDVQDSDDIIIQGCEFDRCYYAVRSFGHHLQVIDNYLHDTYASALWMIDTNTGGPGTQVIGNKLENIALHPGLGELTWGYFGISSNGNNVRIARNTLHNIGYMGIVTSGNDILIEENYVNRAVKIMNDGSAIGFDQIDGGTVRFNIVDSVIGDLESSAPDLPAYVPIGQGIYYGNIFVNDVDLQGNTVANCAGSGIYVDHTTEFDDNIIRDNLMYNNLLQLQFSDNSNDETIGVQCPCFVPFYNTEVYGNTMVSLTSEQITMDLTQTQPPVAPFTHTDFGNFTNNRHFNPYNPQTISVNDKYPGGAHLRRHTVNSWQLNEGEGTGSSDAGIRLNAYEVTQELTGNLISNGTFANDVTGWNAFWPLHANYLTHENNALLDSGYLKVNYDPLQPPFDHLTMQYGTPLSMPTGDWYQLKYSTTSDNDDEFEVKIKGNQQGFNDQLSLSEFFPIETQRNEARFILQSNVPAGDVAHLYFLNDDIAPQYYIDNVELKKVNITPTAPTDDLQLFYNENADGQMSSKTFPLNGCFTDLDGVQVGNSITVAPYRSVVLVKISDIPCTGTNGVVVDVKVQLDGPYNSSNAMMDNGLRNSGAIPSIEPYTSIFGHVGNGGGETLGPNVMDINGPDAIVDWIYLELRSVNDPTQVLHTRAAILQRDGDVVDTDGISPVYFDAPEAAYYLAVRHRNHLGAMTAQLLALSQTSTVIDFTQSSMATWGSDARKNSNGTMLLWSGNVLDDGALKYTGLDNDRDPILQRVGGAIPTATVGGYWNEDVNLDATVKYAGVNNDRDPVLDNIGGIVPTAVRLEQLP